MRIWSMIIILGTIGCSVKQQSISIGQTSSTQAICNPWTTITDVANLRDYARLQTVHQKITLTGNCAGGLISLDVDGDGDLDLAITHPKDNTVRIITNNNGQFEIGMLLSVGNTPVGLTSADLNGDGFNDIVTANQFGNDLTILLGNGSKFPSFDPAISVPIGNMPFDVVAFDADGDGDYDLAASEALGNSVRILCNNGDATWVCSDSYTVGDGPFAIAAGDVTGDSIPDIAVSNSRDNTVSVLPGLGDGTFGAEILHSVGNWPYDLVICGNTIFSANQRGDSISSIVGSVVQTYAVGDSPLSVTCQDWNNDGTWDVMSTNVFSRTISICDGSSGTCDELNPSKFCSRAHTFDMDNDGDSDLAIISCNEQRLTIIRNECN